MTVKKIVYIGVYSNISDTIRKIYTGFDDSLDGNYLIQFSRLVDNIWEIESEKRYDTVVDAIAEYPFFDEKGSNFTVSN